MGRTIAVLLLASAMSLAALLQTPLFYSIWLDLCAPGDHVIQILPPSSSFPAILARTKAKNEVALEVVAGRVSLVEAASLFEQIQQNEAPENLETIPGQSHNEKLCRQVILYVREAERQTNGEGGVAGRLEKELTYRLAAKHSSGPACQNRISQ